MMDPVIIRGRPRGSLLLFVAFSVALIGLVWLVKRYVLPPSLYYPASRIRRTLYIAEYTRVVCVWLAFFMWYADIYIKVGEETQPDPQTIVQFVTDVSLSMAAEDIAPTRFAVAKGFMIDLIEKLPAYPVGVVHFSGIAFPWIPISTSTAAVQEKIRQTTLADFPPLLEFLGTNIGDAVLLAIDRMIEDEGGYNRGAIVLITDGDTNTGTTLDQVSGFAQEREIPIFVFAIGTDEYLIGTTQSGFTEEGEFVPSEDISTPVTTSGLQILAEETGGFLYRIRDPAGFGDASDSIANIIREPEETIVVPNYWSLSRFAKIVLVFLLFFAGIYRLYIILTAKNEV